MIRVGALREVLNERMERLLLASVLFAALPHAWNLEPPVFAYCGLLIGWRLAATWFRLPLPNRFGLLLLTLSGAVLVFWQYQRVYGREGGAGLLLVSVSLKLLEMRTRREVYLVIDLVFFIALTQYLFSQTLPMAAYTLIAVTAAVAVLIGINAGPTLALRPLLQRAAGLVLQAIPLMIVLFLLFPRIAGPLWRLPDTGRSARTGLSDTLEPGSISRLGQSDEAAFRVDFQGEPPPPAQRYWRGPVFWYTDGRRWRPSPEIPAPQPPAVTFHGMAHHYAITLEPHQRRWVFTLELPERLPPELGRSADYLVLAKDKITDRRRFELTSRPAYRTGALTPDERRRGLKLPGPVSPRLRELVASWQQGAAPSEVIQRSLQFFRDQAFYYTLNPPQLANDPVEEFLFETRRGFCEHYATAFVVLMRIAGIPARVVTGYQGGLWNPVGHFLEVRQADAHAWAEVWLAERGWVRVDPTAAVAPERIERSIDVGLLDAGGVPRYTPIDGAIAEGILGLQHWLRRSRLLWASLDHAWNRWVLSYDPARQKRLWETLGIVDWRGLALWLYGLAAAWLVLIARWFWPRYSAALAPEVRLYRRFERKLARRGVLRRPSEGARDFSRRAAAACPESAAAIRTITTEFLAQHYGPSPSPTRLRLLRRLVRGFRA